MEAWRAVGNAVINRRVELGMRARGDLAAATGLTVKTLGEIERGERASYSRATLAVVEHALRWPPGKIDTMVAGPSDAFAPASVGNRVMPPTAVKVAWLLGDDSPLPERDRRTLEATLNKVLEAFWPPLDDVG